MASAQTPKLDLHIEDVDVFVNLPQHVSQIYKGLYDRILFHINVCESHIQKYRKMARFARYALPTGAAIVSVLAAYNADGKMPKIALTVFVLSSVVSVMSTINSIARPLQKYFHHVRYINKFWHLRTEITVGVVEVSDSSVDASEQEKLLYQMLKQYSLAVDQLVQQFSTDSYSLMAPSEGQREDAKRRRKSDQSGRATPERVSVPRTA